MLTALPPSAPLYLARRNPPKKFSEESSEQAKSAVRVNNKNIYKRLCKVSYKFTILS